MATKKTQRNAKKPVRQAPARAAKKSAGKKTPAPVKPRPSAVAPALVSPHTGSYGKGHGNRIEAIASALNGLRARLRASPTKVRHVRTSHAGESADHLDSALKRLGERYRDLLE
jgi:hypothetical protein